MSVHKPAHCSRFGNTNPCVDIMQLLLSEIVQWGVLFPGNSSGVPCLGRLSQTIGSTKHAPERKSMAGLIESILEGKGDDVFIGSALWFSIS